MELGQTTRATKFRLAVSTSQLHGKQDDFQSMCLALRLFLAQLSGAQCALPVNGVMTKMPILAFSSNARKHFRLMPASPMGLLRPLPCRRSVCARNDDHTPDVISVHALSSPIKILLENDGKPLASLCCTSQFR